MLYGNVFLAEIGNYVSKIAVTVDYVGLESLGTRLKLSGMLKDMIIIFKNQIAEFYKIKSKLL